MTLRDRLLGPARDPVWAASLAVLASLAVSFLVVGASMVFLLAFVVLAKTVFPVRLEEITSGNDPTRLRSAVAGSRPRRADW